MCHTYGNDAVAPGSPGGVRTAPESPDCPHLPPRAHVVGETRAPRRPDAGSGAVGEEGVRLLRREGEPGAVEQTNTETLKPAAERCADLSRSAGPPHVAAHWDVAGSGRGAALDGAAVRGGNAGRAVAAWRGRGSGRTGATGGRLALPTAPRGIVILVRGAGRHDPRAQGFADALLGRVLGALLLDLLADGERTPHNVHDILLLARRLRAASQWLRRVTPLPMAYFGMGTGAAAALEAAAGDDIRAVVSRSGRPDLAGPAALAAMKAPTLFVVGELDTWLLGRPRLAADWMRCEHRLAVIPGATPPFTGPRVLDTATALGLDWFTDRLLQPVSGTPRPGAV